MSRVFKATIENKTTSVTTHFNEINKEHLMKLRRTKKTVPFLGATLYVSRAGCGGY